MKYCKCFHVLPVRTAINHIIDEIKEFINSPSMDEWSDIMFGLNRLLGAIFSKRYIKVFPDKLHINKIESRMKEYNCIRSKRAVSIEGKQHT